MEAQRRNVHRARKLFRLALEADPSHLQSLLGLGQLEARAGNPELALQVGGGWGDISLNNLSSSTMCREIQRLHGRHCVVDS